jgi:tripartite ATP-independent transporter DctM subunit
MVASESDAVATPAPATPIATRRRFGIHSIENGALSIALAAMVILPLAEGVLRATLHTGITGASIIVQHLGLLVGMIGGAIAAREGRLLALSTIGDTVLRGVTKQTGRMLNGSVSALIAAFLAKASQQFVASERPFGKILVYGIPVWAIELALPVGFTVIALRLLYRASDTWPGRFAAAGLAGVMTMLVLTLPDASTRLFVPALVVLAVAVLIGAPAFVALGGTALILFWWMGEPIAAIPVSHYSLVMNPTIPTLPLFTLAGYLLAESRAPARLVRVFNALFGRFRGGPAVVTVLVCAFFTSFTGASGVTILALGGLLMPILRDARYTEKDALGLVTGAGSMGMLLPPCLPVIVYAIIARLDMKALFLGGFVPALLMIVVTAWWGIQRGPKRSGAPPPFDGGEARAAVWEARWELLTPFVALGALFSGLGTPVEAAALTALYVLIVEAGFHRDLKMFSDVPRVMTECGLLVGGILLILGVALGFTNYLVIADVPTLAIGWTKSTIHSPILFLLLLNVFLLIVGCLMDIYSAIIIQVPLLVPLGAAFGVDPIQLGIIFLANLELGYLTPPVGLNLYMSSYRFGKPVPAVLMSVLPIIIVLHIGTLLITYIPPLTTALPRWFGY